MKLHYLGTAAAEGIPAVFCGCDVCRRARELGGKNIRTRAQMLIDDALLCDLGPDTFAHALANDIDLGAIEHVLITHSHSDHFYAEDLVFRCEPYGHNDNRQPLTLYGNKKVGNLLEMVVDIYNDTPNFETFVSYKEISAFKDFRAGNYIITPLKAKHDDNEDCFIFEIADVRDGKRCLYAHDTAMLPEEDFAHLASRRLDVVSLDCTMGTAPNGGSHMVLADCINVKNRLILQGSADESTVFIINHFSHNCGLTHEQLCAAAEPHGFITAFDGMIIEV